MPRDARPLLARRYPVLVTVRLCEGLTSLRRAALLPVLQRAFTRASERPQFRVVHASIQSNHVHLLVEARDAESLAHGMCGLQVRIARGLNRVWRRRGKVQADRYHARVLRTPIEVRRALVYVLQNARKHGCGGPGVDPYSSGPWFDGWREPPDARDRGFALRHDSPFASARTWLLRVGWRKHGLIGLGESPSA